MELSFYTNFANSLANQEQQINALQAEISSGQAVTTPDQNPAAFEAATLGSDQVQALTTENTTQSVIQVQLGSVNDTYSSVNSLLDNVQSLVEQALNGTTSTSNKASLAVEVQSNLQQLVSLGNTTAPNGTYLFGGTRGSVAPFQVNPSTGQVEYLGDGGSSQAAITPNSDASTIANGDVFESGLAGDGTSSISAASTNTGSGQILSEGVVNSTQAAAFQQGNSPVQISFTYNASTLTTSYTATEGGTAIATGPLNGDKTSIQVNGSEYVIQGQPAAGDTFTISPSRPQSVFQLVQNIYTALTNTGSTPTQQAQTNQALNQALSGLAQYQQAFSMAQAQNGVTLQAITNASTSNTQQSDQIQQSVQSETGVNMPVALTTMDEQITNLQAAMKTFSTVSSLSLFAYI